MGSVSGRVRWRRAEYSYFNAQFFSAESDVTCTGSDYDAMTTNSHADLLISRTRRSLICAVAVNRLEKILLKQWPLLKSKFKAPVEQGAWR